MTVTTANRLPSNTDYSWLAGNDRLKNLSGQLLGAHIAHAGLIMFWAGATTISEVARFVPSQPISEQGMVLLPHLASLGWGVGSGGVVVDTYPYFVIGLLHLISSAVLGAGGLFHALRGPAILNNAQGHARKFHYEWSDSKKLSFILGHHLIFLGVAALLFVGKATVFGGIYDSAVGDVRVISNPTLNPFTIFGYIFGLVDNQWNPLGMAAVNNLEDVIGGHIWIGVMCLVGGAWHIITEPFSWIKDSVTFNGDGILSYSLAALAFMAFTSIYFVGFNTTVFPNEFYGANRDQTTAIQLFLCITFLIGHIWHAFKARSNQAFLSDKDKFSAFIVGFLVVAVLVIGLVSLSFS